MCISDSSHGAKRLPIHKSQVIGGELFELMERSCVSGNTSHNIPAESSGFIRVAKASGGARLVGPSMHEVCVMCLNDLFQPPGGSGPVCGN